MKNTKTYKLLKDIDCCNAGQVFEYPYLHENATIETAACVNLMDCISLNYKEWFEEIKEVKSIYELYHGDVFFHISEGVIKDYLINDLDIYNEYCNYGNVFLTKEEAETELQKRKAMATIKKWSHDNDGGYKFNNNRYNNNRYNHYIDFNEDAKELETDSYSFTRRHSEIYYSDSNVVNKAMIELEAEYKILFDI